MIPSQGMLWVIVGLQSALLLYIAWGDIATRLIPNRMCLLLATAGLVMQVFAGPVQMAESVIIAFVLFWILLFLHSQAALGGGDVKLLLALSVGLPPAGIVTLFAITGLAGGVLVVLHLAMRHLPRPVRASSACSIFRRVYVAERWRILRHAPLPYGVAIACGGIWAVMTTTHIGG